MTTRVLAPLAIATALALPAAANAAVRCVGTSGGDCTTTHVTTDDAVAASVDGDTIRFGPGTFGQVNTTKVLTFVGAGAGTVDSSAGATLILQSAASMPGMNLRRGGTVRDLRVQGGPSSGSSSAGSGIQFEPFDAGDMRLDITDVIATGGDTAPPAVPGGAALGVGGMTAGSKVVTVTRGAFLAGPDPTDAGFGVYACCIETHLNDTLIRTPSGPGLAAAVGGSITVDHSTVEGSTAIQTSAPQSLTVNRSRVTGSTVGMSLNSDFTYPTPNVSVRDSLVTATGGPGAVVAVQLVVNTAQPVSFTGVGSTFLARGDTPAAIYARRAADGNGALTTTLRNSIAHAESATGNDLWADRATIGADFSSFNTRKLENGGTAPDPGSGSNVAGDPMLAADAGLQTGSPLIDRGDPSVLLPGELDLAGVARSLDGTGDCVAMPDIGAFERPDVCPPPPNVPPELTKVSVTNRVFAPLAKAPRARGSARKRRVKRGTRFRYTLSEAARMRIRIERVVRRHGRTRYKRVTTLGADKQAGRQFTRFTGWVRHRAVKPGRYRARLVATDALGASSPERRVAFRVVRR